MKISHLNILSIILLHVLFFSLGLTAAIAYSTSGYKWNGTSASYYISSTFAASFRTAMQASDAAWDAAGSKFRFKYLGTTTRNPNTFSSYSLDGFSNIGYFNNGNTGIIATTRGGVTNLTDKIISERDTTLNTYYGFTTVGAAGSYDVQNIMTHEFGHWLKLLDLSSVWGPSFCTLAMESTMCGTTVPGETRKRTLEGDDKAGIKNIYGI